MKNLTAFIFIMFLVGCSSPPEQTQPIGELSRVYALQHELNERPTLQDQQSKEGAHKRATTTGAKK